MDQVPCKKCLISYKKRYLVAHEAKCMGGIDGFTPVVDNKRIVYRCQTCGLSVRK